MHIISPHLQEAIRSIGFQDYKDDIQYVISPYIVELEVDEGILIYNLLTRSIVLLSKIEYHNLSIDNFQWLVQNWFYIPKDINPVTIPKLQKKNYGEKYPRKKYGALEICTIVTTTTCNASCPYCYESGSVKSTMSEEIALDVVDFLSQRHANTICLNWFGGEPLLNSKVMDIICTGLEKNNIHYYSSIISNGILIDQYDEKTIKDIWKVRNLQITLDGTKDTYNRVKGYSGIEIDNAFDRVIKNIQYLIDMHVYVKIRLNLSLDNYDDLISLVDYLSQEFLGNQYIGVYSSILFEGLGNPPFILNDRDRTLLYNNAITLDNYIIQKGIGMNQRIPKMKFYQCGADSGRLCVVLPNGDLGLCEHHLDDEHYGSIYDNHYDRSVLERWRTKQLEEDECKNCFYYPQCVRLELCPTIPKCDENYRRYKKNQIQNLIKNVFKRSKRNEIND